MPIAKTAKLGPFLGINNRLERHALSVPKTGDYLADAVGADLDVTGRLSRADGSTSVAALTTGRSLFCDGERMLYADGTILKRITDMTTYAASTVDTVAASRVAYEPINGEIFYTDGVKLACLQADNTVRPVGIPVPTSLSGAAILTGTLQPAWYQATITYFQGAEEGGAYPSINVELTATGGVRFTLPASPAGVTAIGVYLSGPNGEVPMLYDVVAPATATVDLTAPPTGRACETQFKAPMPAGSILTHIPGRLLVAAGDFVYYSDPYNFGLTTPAKNYVPFSKPVSVMIACEVGVYVVADKAYWLPGLDSPEMSMPVVLPYGAVAYSQTRHPTEKKVFWLSEKGLIVGDNQGQVANMQEKALLLNLSGEGASLFIEGNNRIVTTNG
ncbi:MAG: hypothetical protein A2Y38_16565 [Spirochaetes bacterium GWB1_59_5]|nr:MAG: hypothetical protein A2Y38_16565 [Spirochaetes bacterium GWB1_59_5]